MYRFLFKPSERVVFYISAWLSSTYTVVPSLHAFSGPTVIPCTRPAARTHLSVTGHTHVLYKLLPNGSVIYCALWEETEDHGENPCRHGEDVWKAAITCHILTVLNFCLIWGGREQRRQTISLRSVFWNSPLLSLLTTISLQGLTFHVFKCCETDRSRRCEWIFHTYAAFHSLKSQLVINIADSKILPSSGKILAFLLPFKKACASQHSLIKSQIQSNQTILCKKNE